MKCNVAISDSRQRLLDSTSTANVESSVFSNYYSIFCINKLCRRPPQYPPPLQVDLQPIDLESGVGVTCDVGFLCANFSLPKPLLLISKRRQYTYSSKVDIIPASSFNVITVVLHLRDKNTFTTNAFYDAVFYYFLLSMNSIIILST